MFKNELTLSGGSQMFGKYFSRGLVRGFIHTAYKQTVFRYSVGTIHEHTNHKCLIHPRRTYCNNRTNKCGLFIRTTNEIHSLIPLRSQFVTFSKYLTRSRACQIIFKRNKSLFIKGITEEEAHGSLWGA